MAPDSDDDAAALRDRVKQLEQTVADQQATIESLQQPPASRRGVLAALTGVAGAGALGAYSQRASAQAAGQIGTSSEPVDVEAWSLNVQGQLAGDLDAGGNNLTNVREATVQNANIANYTADTLEYVIYEDDNSNLGAIERTGNLIAGGPDAKNVSDQTDLGELLEYIVNTHSTEIHPSIGISGGRPKFKTSASLDKCIYLEGPGRNSIVIGHELGGNDVITFTNPSSNIVQFNRLKFDGRADGGTGEPTRWLKTDGAGEILITNTEMRNATTWAAELIDPQSPNYVQNSWFISGAGLRIENGNQIVLSGNEFRGETLEIKDCANVEMGINRGAVYNVINSGIQTENIDSVGVVQTGASDGQTHAIAASHSDTGGGQIRNQTTTGVGTSATAIAESTGGQKTNLYLVHGYRPDSIGDRFGDLLLQLTTSTPTVLHSETVGTPDGRTYTSTANILELEMAANSYDVNAISLIARSDGT